MEKRNAPLNISRKSPRGQQGVVLVVALLLLLILTLIGLSATETTVMQERMAGNTRDREIAFEAAEAALRAAEQYIQAHVSTNTVYGANGLYEDGTHELWTNAVWSSDSNSRKYDPSVADAKWATPPRYVIEILGSLPKSAFNANLETSYLDIPKPTGETKMFRITARGTGITDTAVVYLQTTYAKQL
jgi:type IV pilus assembly protein PilX